MKIKSFLLLLIVSFSCLSYGITGSGYKLISERVESSEDTIGGFIYHPYHGFAQTWSKAYDAKGKIGINVKVRGNHSFTIANNTSVDQKYTFILELKCDNKFFKKEDVIVISPGGHIEDYEDSYIETYHARTGAFNITARTTIRGESEDSYANTGTLWVFK